MNYSPNSQAALASTTKTSSRTKLLTAVERLVIDSGIASLSIRRIAAESGVNSQLIGYHFGGMDGLIEELLWCNLEPINQMRRALLKQLTAKTALPSIDEVMNAFLRPFWLEAAHNPGVHATIVVSEIITNGPPALREQMMEKVRVAYHELADALAPLVPHLSHASLLWRICSVSGSVMAVTPRLYTPNFFFPLKGELPTFTDEQWYKELFAFARGAILAPAAS